MDVKDTLETLYLKNNRIGYKGIKDLELFIEMNKLDTLDLSCNRISDGGILDIFKAMKCIKVL